MVPTNCALGVQRAYVLLRRCGNTVEEYTTPAGSLRHHPTKLLKIGASFGSPCGGLVFALAESCPYQAIFAQVFANLNQWRSQLGPAARHAQLAPA